MEFARTATRDIILITECVCLQTLFAPRTILIQDTA